MWNQGFEASLPDFAGLPSALGGLGFRVEGLGLRL